MNEHDYFLCKILSVNNFFQTNIFLHSVSASRLIDLGALADHTVTLLTVFSCLSQWARTVVGSAAAA